MIAQVAVPSPLRKLFDYLVPATSQVVPGMRVLVSFGRREVIGVVLALTQESTIEAAKIKPILAVCDEEPVLTQQALELATWISNYYHHPIGDVVSNFVPALLRDPKAIVPGAEDLQVVETPTPEIPELNTHQSAAIEEIQRQHGFQVFLLDGVTGSGKTEVYLRLIAALITKQQQALVLVPEINLTPQTVARFQQRFKVPIVVLHSRCTKKERWQAWCAARSGLAPIVIGTRSAVFVALKNPGIIIIDEEHDLSFRQQAGLRYSARDIAIMRAKLAEIPIVLGSATPALESINNAQHKKFTHLVLPERAGNAIHPTFHVLDLRGKKLVHGLSENLIRAMDQHLQNAGQVLVFLNRRGYAPTLLCKECGWVAECQHCDARLIVHQKSRTLLCHHCGRMLRMPAKCPKCGQQELTLLGVGTERVADALQEIFPQAALVRVDRDTTRRKQAFEQLLTGIQQKRYQILIGTQMLAKGHHFPDVTMVAILNVDYGLFSADFRATEHLAQLIVQVAGRAGRVAKPGEVYLQTYNPKHPMLLNLLQNGFQSFAAIGLQERKLAQLPPFSYLALLRVQAKQQALPQQFLQTLHNNMAHFLGVKILGPIPAYLERKDDWYRAQLLIQSKVRDNLHHAVDAILELIHTSQDKHKVQWSLEIDPAEIL